MKVTAKVRRSGGWWAIEVPEVEGVFTQARRLDQVPAMTADAVATMLEQPVDQVDVEVDVVLDDIVLRSIHATKAAAVEAARAQVAASSSMRSAVRSLRADGLSGRDVATLLEVSHQRVSQLEKSF